MNDFALHLIVIVFIFHFTEFAGIFFKCWHVSGKCRKLRFTIGPIHGHRLENHVIRTIDAINEDICKVKCLLEPNCVSYNFKTEANTAGKHKRDLSNASYEHDNEHSGDLAKKENYVYRGAEVDIELHLYNIVKISLCCFIFSLHLRR